MPLRNHLFLVLPWLLFTAHVTRPETPHQPLRPAKDRAIFFAVEQYQNGKLSNLQNPVKNARDIAAEMKTRFGFETEILENSTQEQIIDKLNELTRLYERNEDGRHPSDGQLFLFFSGHGMSEDENGYFLPADADPAKPYEKGIAYEIWRPKIDKINCRHLLVAIDACYSVRFDPDWKNKPDGQFKRPGEMTDSQRALANYETYKARVFFTSDNKEDQTPDRSNFARKLIEGFQSAGTTDGFLTSKQLFANFVEGATPTPRAGTFGSDEPSSAFLFYSLNSTTQTPSGEHIMPTDLSDWNDAKANNTIEDYREYMEKHPSGDFIEAALAKIDLLERTSADTSNTTIGEPFNYTPPEPVGGKLTCAAELGSTGFNSFIITADLNKNWKLVKANFGVNIIKEGLTSDDDIKNGLKNFISDILSFGVNPRDIHFVVSAGMKNDVNVEKIKDQLKNMNYFVNEITPEQEARFSLRAAIPEVYRDKGFLVDLGSGNTKISWQPDMTIITFGAKYYQGNTSDNSVYEEVKNKASQIPASLRTIAFITGGVPYELAKISRTGKNRYTVLYAPADYKPEGVKQKSGLIIYKAIADATGCRQFVFDWDANYCIGFLLSL